MSTSSPYEPLVVTTSHLAKPSTKSKAQTIAPSRKNKRVFKTRYALVATAQIFGDNPTMLRLTLLVSASLFLSSLDAYAEPRTPATSPSICSVILEPTREEIAAYIASSPFATGLQRFSQSQYVKAAALLSEAWQKLQSSLNSVFGQEKCDLKAIRATMRRTIQSVPPLVIPGEDRFLLPTPVRHALARSLCLLGRIQDAASVLVDAALAGDEQDLAAAGVLLAASGKPQLCLSLIPEPTSRLLILARAFCLAHANEPEKAKALLASAPPAAYDRLSAAIMALLRDILTFPEEQR